MPPRTAKTQPSEPSKADPILYRWFEQLRSEGGLPKDVQATILAKLWGQDIRIRDLERQLRVKPKPDPKIGQAT